MNNMLNLESLYKMRTADIAAYSQNMAEGFTDSTLIQHFLGKKSYSCDKASMIFKMQIKSMGKDVFFYSTSEKMEGTIVMVPPNYALPSNIRYIMAGALALPITVRPGVLPTMSRYERFSYDIMQRQTGGKSWYLFSLCIKKEFQGKGMATRLLTPFFNFFDSTNQSCYLETHKISNIDIYKHYGFHVAKTAIIPATTINHFPMIRNPQKPMDTAVLQRTKEKG